MRLKLFTTVIALSFISAAADARVTGPDVSQGTATTIRGSAHIERGAEGTYIELANPDGGRRVFGYISFSDEPTFPGVMELNGRNLEISGVMVLSGRAMIVLTDPDQLRVSG